ncbi:hypothetical protein N9M53_03365 [Alphaproteobacteria bacterium]|nr:hypothetical protein [Alphaproteobacteria bacterium]
MSVMNAVMIEEKLDEVKTMVQKNPKFFLELVEDKMFEIIKDRYALSDDENLLDWEESEGCNIRDRISETQIEDQVSLIKDYNVITKKQELEETYLSALRVHIPSSIWEDMTELHNEDFNEFHEKMGSLF